MSQFQNTVTKLARTPGKVALLRMAPHVLVKEAAKADGLLKKIFGGAKSDQTVSQSILEKVIAGATLTGVTATGALLAAQLEDHFLGNTDQHKATNSEIGKLNAQNQFKTQMLFSLKPLHVDVLSTLMKDEVIGQADKGMITSAFETMKRFAPNLAADENAARSFLREHAIYGTGPSYASLKNLADAEQAVAKAGGALPM